MTDLFEKNQLIEALLRLFENATRVTAGPIVPQICVLKLSTGHIVGGIANNPLSHDNYEAEDALQMAVKTAHDLPAGILKGEFEIIALAMNTTRDEKSGKLADIDLGLYEQSFWELTNFKAENLLLVDPVSKTSDFSKTFPEYGFVS